jgi:transposase
MKLILILNVNQESFFYKKRFKNQIIRNGDNFLISFFGFATDNGNSVISYRRKSKTFDMDSFLGEIRVNNMECKENAAKLQLLINDFAEKIDQIRQSKINKVKVQKSIIKEEIIKSKIELLNNSFKETYNDVFKEIIDDEKELMKLINIDNIEEEIRHIKFLKRGLFDNEKVQSEKRLLNQFIKELDTEEWREIFKKEKGIALVLDNAKIHIAALTKKIAKILNIKLVFLEKYASDLNPIERVWYAIKDKLSVKFIDDETFLIGEFGKYFHFYANSPTLSKNKLLKYIT